MPKGVSPWYLVKNVKIFQLFLLGIIGKETIFDDILDRKQAFLDYNNKKIKKEKNWDFFKEATSISGSFN